MTKDCPVCWVSQATWQRCSVTWGCGLLVSGVITKTQSLHNTTLSDGHQYLKGWGKLNNTTGYSTWNFLRTLLHRYINNHVIVDNSDEDSMM